MDGSISALGRTVRRFLDWWLAELAGLVPERVRSVFRPTGEVLMVDLSADDPAFSVWDGRRRKQLGHVDWSLLASGKIGRPLRSVLRRAKSGRARIVACLPVDRVLVCHLSLPEAALSNLRRALQLQIDQLTPFALEDACFDFRIERHDSSNKRIDVELVVAQRSAVAEVVATTTAWGMPPDQIDVAKGGAESGPELNLLADDNVSEDVAGPSYLPTMLKVLAACLVVAAIYIPLDRQQTTVDRLTAQVAAARKQAEVVIALRDEIDNELAAGNFLAEKRRGTLPQVLILHDLTQLLSDDIWLIQYHKDEKTVRLSGFAPSASDLIQVIDSSDLFLTPKFIAPVTKDPTLGGDRFSISFEFEEGAQ